MKAFPVSLNVLQIFPNKRPVLPNGILGWESLKRDAAHTQLSQAAALPVWATHQEESGKEWEGEGCEGEKKR